MNRIAQSSRLMAHCVAVDVPTGIGDTFCCHGDEEGRCWGAEPRLSQLQPAAAHHLRSPPWPLGCVANFRWDVCREERKKPAREEFSSVYKSRLGLYTVAYRKLLCDSS